MQALVSWLDLDLVKLHEILGTIGLAFMKFHAALFRLITRPIIAIVAFTPSVSSFYVVTNIDCGIRFLRKPLNLGREAEHALYIRGACPLACVTGELHPFVTSFSTTC